jgi:hypothetical protein
MLPPLRNCFVLFGLLLALAPLAASQQTPSLPLPAPADQEQIVPYWTTETGWMSELQLRNNQLGHDLTVTPVLRLAAGGPHADSACGALAFSIFPLQPQELPSNPS